MLPDSLRAHSTTFFPLLMLASVAACLSSGGDGKDGDSGIVGKDDTAAETESDADADADAEATPTPTLTPTATAAVDVDDIV
ncbi:MAG TPA: hypothetical protein DFR83_06260, partial [Deltaproteobacteria bacterium]|nr:hypothetical protein [Deltaproteobacteria bacterium]